MVAKTYIESTLIELDILYNSATSQKKIIYYSKLATIELCGWLEESFDNIIITCANRKLKEANNKKFVKKDVVKKNYGFHYENNIRPMLFKLIGLIELEKIEKRLERTGQISILSANLTNLVGTRNDAAHTYLKGITRTYNAPSVALGYFRSIYPIIIALDTELRNL